MDGSVAGRRRFLAAVLGTAITLVVGCSEPTFPRDVEGTLRRVMDEQVLRVGATENLPWSEVGDDASVAGVEADILLAYADTLGAAVQWTSGAESQLILSLEEGHLDVVMGGLRADSPWSAKAALTRAHSRSTGPDGEPEELVFAVRRGENALLTSLERFVEERSP